MVPQSRWITLAEGEEISIRRASEADCSRAAARDNMFLVNSHISKHHGAIRLTKGEFYIKDNSSTFGTVLNDCFLVPGKWKCLADYDTVGFVVSRHSTSIQKIVGRFDDKTTSTIPLREFGFPTVALQYKVLIDGNKLLLIPLNSPEPPASDKNLDESSSTPVLVANVAGENLECESKSISASATPIYDKTIDITTEVFETQPEDTQKLSEFGSESILNAEELVVSLPLPSTKACKEVVELESDNACSNSESENTVLESEGEEDVVELYSIVASKIAPAAVIIDDDDDDDDVLDALDALDDLDDLNDSNDDLEDEEEDEEEADLHASQKEALSAYSGDQIVWTSEESCDCIECDGECYVASELSSDDRNYAVLDDEDEDEEDEDEEDDDDNDDESVSTDSDNHDATEISSAGDLLCGLNCYVEGYELWPESTTGYSDDCCRFRGEFLSMLESQRKTTSGELGGRKRGFRDVESDQSDEEYVPEEELDIASSRPTKRAKVEKDLSRIKAIFKEVGKGLVYVTGTIVALGLYGRSKANLE